MINENYEISGSRSSWKDGNCYGADGKSSPQNPSDFYKKETIKECEDFCFKQPRSTGCEYYIKSKECLYHTDVLNLAATGKKSIRCLVILERNKDLSGDCPLSVLILS